MLTDGGAEFTGSDFMLTDGGPPLPGPGPRGSDLTLSEYMEDKDGGAPAFAESKRYWLSGLVCW